MTDHSAGRKSAPAKTQGAPRKRDAARTREAILQAALVEFCENGFGGARVDAISLRANANMRLLYHYFGDKDGLYKAVLDHVYTDIRVAEQRLNLADLDPATGMSELVDFTFRFFRDHQDYISILNNENLLRAQHMRQSEQIRALTLPLVASIRDLLKRGSAAGVFRADADPIQLYVSITALSYFHVSNRFTLSAMFDRDLSSKAWLEQRRRHARDMVLTWLTSDPSTDAAARSTPPRKRASARQKD